MDATDTLGVDVTTVLFYVVAGLGGLALVVRTFKARSPRGRSLNVTTNTLLTAQGILYCAAAIYALLSSGTTFPKYIPYEALTVACTAGHLYAELVYPLKRGLLRGWVLRLLSLVTVAACSYTVYERVRALRAAQGVVPVVAVFGLPQLCVYPCVAALALASVLVTSARARAVGRLVALVAGGALLGALVAWIYVRVTAEAEVVAIAGGYMAPYFFAVFSVAAVLCAQVVLTAKMYALDEARNERRAAQKPEEVYVA